MSKTLLESDEIGSIQRNDFDITTTGQAIITKIIAGTGVTISSTGVDTGTGDVTINASGGSALTLAAIGSVPNANAATLTGSVLNLQPASASFGGILSAPSVAQTIGGNKAFSGIININNKLILNGTNLATQSTSTDASYLFNTGTFSSGIITEASGVILSYGINCPQVGTRDTTVVGGIFRFDTRVTGFGTAFGDQAFTILGYATGSSSALNRLSVSLQNGDTILNANGGSLIATSLSGTGTRMVVADPTGILSTQVIPGITRSIVNISTNTTGAAVASTEYVYFASNTITFTLPTAVGNTNRYTIVFKTTGTLTIATTLGQTIAFYPSAPATTATITKQGTVVELFSDGTNWWTI